MLLGLAHDVGHVADDLDVPPEAGNRGGRNIGDHHGIHRVGHLDDGCAVTASVEDELPAVVGPTPAVVSIARRHTAELLEAPDAHQVESLARVLSCHAILTWGLGHG